jgi:type VI secretion system secreted protein VgrG
MAEKYNTDNRTTTILINGKGPFIVTKVNIKESISDSSLMTVDFISDTKFKPSDLGQNVTVTHKLNNNKKINFNLLATNIIYEGYSLHRGFNHYKLIASDPLSILKQDVGTRIFQKKSTKEIISTIFKNTSLNSCITFKTNNDGQNRNFCIQLNENSYDFIKRLCAEEGWHFHCKHDNKTNLFIASNNQEFTEYPKDISYLNPTTEISDVVKSFTNSINIGTNKIDLKDFSLINGKAFDNESVSSIKTPLNLSIMDYGFNSKDKTEITNLSKKILACADMQKETFYATSKNINLQCGTKFNLKNHPNTDYNQSYLITEIEHNLIVHESGLSEDYENTFKCIPFKNQFKTNFISKPVFSGTLTATVTGPNDKEVYTDGKGRVKVLIHFDRESKPDENSSIWIPVAQSFASSGYGSLFLPRVGTTVLITFLNGDIDKPVILSSLYTDDQKLPFSSNTQSGFKTHSYPNAQASAFNELRFDDQKDKEQIYIQAQKDFIKNINNDDLETIKGSKKITIDKQFTTSSKEEVSHETEKSLSLSSKENFSIVSDADFSNKVKGKYKIESKDDIAITTDNKYSLKSKSNINIDGKEITLTGKNNITLKVGNNSIEITSSGITIKGTSITIKGTNTKLDATNLEANGSANVKIKGANININANAKAAISGLITDVKATTMTTVQGSAMLTLKGGLTRIN